MNWENTFQRLKRFIEVREGLYCKHLPLFIIKDNTVVNKDNKTVCKKCCDHYGCETYINKKLKKVCPLCCQHNAYNREPFCDVCFSVVPQTMCPPINCSMYWWRVNALKQKEKKKKKARKKQKQQTKYELTATAKSLGLKKFYRLNKADLKVLIDNHQFASHEVLTKLAQCL